MASPEALRLLQEAVAAILSITSSCGDASGKAARNAWGDLKTGVNQAGAHLGEVMDEVTDERSSVLGFIGDFGTGVKMYRAQAEAMALSLLKLPEWEAAANRDPALKAKLVQLGSKIEDKLGPAPELPKAPEPAASPALAVAGAAAPVSEAVARPLAASPVVAPAAALAVAAAAAREPAPAAAPEVFVPPPRDFLAAAPSFLEVAPRKPSKGPVSSLASAADETRHMLRSGFKAMADIHFEIEDAKGDTEKAMSVFNELAPAVSRAHFEYTRHTRPRTDYNGEDSASEAGTPHSMPSRPTFSFETDYLAETLDGLAWEPMTVLKFLHSLRMAKRIHAKRIQSVATMLTQISPTYRDAVRSDQFLMKWLGVIRGESEPLHLVSYGFASSLRWATWHAGWHWVHRRRHKTDVSEKHHKIWTSRKESLTQSSELPKEVIEKLLDAAWSAVQHCVIQRWPEEGRGLAQTMMSWIKPTDDEGPLKDEFLEHFQCIEDSKALQESLCGDLSWMIWNMAWHVANKSKNYSTDSQQALVRAERHLQRAFRGVNQWRGVNLGGWFLLEPGPCTHFWEKLPPQAKEQHCEWGACAALGPNEAASRLREHRKTYFTKEDFAEMKAAGLTHVRLPFGAWCVVGPRPGEPYVGPCLDQLDQAMNDLEAAGMNVLLDLHGTPGGESAEPPCGRKDDKWCSENWSAEESLKVLGIVAKRYAGRSCVCGIGVMNEPSETHPAQNLTKYYEDAVEVVRRAGMRAGSVAVVLPIFTEYRIGEFLGLWEQNFAAYEDCVFDVHFYQCFGRVWSMKSLEGHMEAAKTREATLRSLPMCCVSEWSIAFPGGVAPSDEVKLKETYKRFGEIQLKAYETATHGWFFWTWKDSAGIDWNLQECLKQGIIEVPKGGRDSDMYRP